MNLEELRNAMASDATEENKKLRREVQTLREHLHNEKEDHKADVRFLINDCMALSNRCWALTHGTMCGFCELNAFKCVHALPLDKKLAIAKKLMEE